MPRPPRDTAAGIFHVFTHCVWAVPAHFRDDIDRMNFLRRLAFVSSESEWKCICYCLMRSHYHLIVEVGDGVLPVAMHALNLGYAIGFNDRHDLRGTTQSHRYGARRIVDETDLVDTFVYVVVRNPLEAGLCESPEKWRWSSYAATIGIVEKPGFVDDERILSCFANSELDPRAALRAYVENL